MPGQTIDEIEARIAGSPNLGDENREALLQLLKVLRTEVTDLSATSVEDARNITAQADAATRPEQNEDVIQNAIVLSQHPLFSDRIAVRRCLIGFRLSDGFRWRNDRKLADLPGSPGQRDRLARHPIAHHLGSCQRP